MFTFYIMPIASGDRARKLQMLMITLAIDSLYIFPLLAHKNPF